MSSPISRLDLPYNNLVLTGFLGVGKSTIGRHIAQRLELDYFDVDEEIEIHETMSIGKIRELYGDSRLRTLEHEMCRHAALMRRSVVVVSGAAIGDERNFNILTETGTVVILTCDLGEALRRMHLASEQRFRDAGVRQRMFSRLRREYEVTKDTRILQLDTTHMTVEEESDLLIRHWMSGESEGPYFRYGPSPRIMPPPRPITGITSRLTKQKKDS